jgi:hypothetical protein
VIKESNLAHQEIKGSDPIDSEPREQTEQVPMEAETTATDLPESDEVEQTPSD